MNCPKCGSESDTLVTPEQDFGGGAFGCVYIGERCRKCGFEFGHEEKLKDGEQT